MKGTEWVLWVKFDPEQPRVPAGDPRGGQWTSSPGGMIASNVLANDFRVKYGVDCEIRILPESEMVSLFGTETVGRYDPKNHTIELSDRLKPEQPVDTSKFGPNAKSTGAAGDVMILLHEMAHEVDIVDEGWRMQGRYSDLDEFKRGLYPKAMARWIKGDDSHIFSRYSMINASEYFAEGLAVFHAAPDYLKRTNPDLYAFMEKVQSTLPSRRKDYERGKVEVFYRNGDAEWIDGGTPA